MLSDWRTTILPKSKHAIILGRRGGLGRSTSYPPTSEEINAARILGKVGGVKGGTNRASILSPEKRKEIAVWASLVAKFTHNPSTITKEDIELYEEFRKLGYKTKEDRRKAY